MNEISCLCFIAVFFINFDVCTSQACGGDISVRNLDRRNPRGFQRLFSPDYMRSAQYASNLVCVWTFHFGPTDRINFRFRDFKLEGDGKTCDKDFVKILFSNKEEEDTYCGLQTPGPAYGSGPVKMTFKTDEKNNFRGFFIMYQVMRNVLPTPDACRSNPCKNGGKCNNVRYGYGYKCTCLAEYTGKDCEIKIEKPEPKAEPCESNPCQNEATCTNDGDNYRCQCVEGWEGTNCEQDIDECSSNPCQNGGSCENLLNKFKCNCLGGWEGDTCDKKIDVNECESDPCLNGGSCVDGEDKFTCQCTAGWTGVTCDTDIDDCSPNPCKNGGECTDGPNTFTCNCKAGWTGDSCDTNIDDCSPNPCKNGGACKDKLNDFECSCKSPWSGKTCDKKEESAPTPKPTPKPKPEKKKYCVPNPCRNGGSCTEKKEDFKCKCDDGWEGKTCESKVKEPEKQDVNECASNPCSEDLECIDKVNSYLCRKECNPGFTGDDCEIDINECDSAPCKNGGKCIDEENKFLCKCDTGFSGLFCEISNPCEGDPCKNGGTCHKSSSLKANSTGFICACNLGWSGDTCQEVVLKGCRNPDDSSKGLVPFGVSLEFYCGKGFVLTGPNIITCQESGEFTHVVPECISDTTDPSAANQSAMQAIKSPMVFSMVVAAGVIFILIGVFLLYIFFFAPWNSPRREATE
uniref:fibropellin-1-like n=1 Tax=Styela clava TaxID=7725 RepID=UPI00193A0755|nr:fibropellin-1-like [Styela clava]